MVHAQLHIHTSIVAVPGFQFHASSIVVKQVHLVISAVPGLRGRATFHQINAFLVESFHLNSETMWFLLFLLLLRDRKSQMLNNVFNPPIPPPSLNTILADMTHCIADSVWSIFIETVWRDVVLASICLIDMRDLSEKVSGQYTIQNPLSGIHYPGSTIRDPLYGIHYPRSTIRDPLSRIHYPRSTIQDPLSRIHYPGFTIQDPEEMHIT